jgi:uncharacterized protein YjfI (DUF2170 family)
MNSNIRDDNFYVNAIKMDLYRVFHMGAQVLLPFDAGLSNTFLGHALQTFPKLSSNSERTDVMTRINTLSSQAVAVSQNVHERLRWSERVMTLYCLLR